jgi:hypothetical protein
MLTAALTNWQTLAADIFLGVYVRFNEPDSSCIINLRDRASSVMGKLILFHDHALKIILIILLLYFSFPQRNLENGMSVSGANKWRFIWRDISLWGFTILQADRKVMQPILKYLLVVAIQYNSIGLINTQYRCDYTRAHAGHVML